MLTMFMDPKSIISLDYLMGVLHGPCKSIDVLMDILLYEGLDD